MPTYPHIPYQALEFEEAEMRRRSDEFRAYMERRRSLRFFSDRPVPKEIIENIVMTASSAPSGAHKQPWTFCVVGDPTTKRRIREAAEAEERESYGGRMSKEWLRDLEPLGTDWQKPFLETAPWLIVVFKKAYEIEGGERRKCYYVSESVGIATGFLLAAIHHAGLATLTHTPSPMNFLQTILERPDNERPFLLLPVGHPAEGATVPDLRRKGLEEVSVWL
ncbi:MAG: nitroreductase family protein [Saprospiraceae bacterium]|jgi:nitroreductase|nr:nitroreductase family protein [Saprospiraceae bacterium]